MVYTFACTIGSFIDEDWELMQYVVDFQPLAEQDHVGVYAGKAFVESARSVGGLDKVIISCLLIYCRRLTPYSFLL